METERQLPDRSRVLSALMRQKRWQRGDQLATVRVGIGGVPDGRVTRYGLYRLGALVGVVRETRIGSIILDKPNDGCSYERVEP